VKGKSNERGEKERKYGGGAKDSRDGKSVSDDASLHEGHGTAV
jgi:hypothetical protein